MPYLSVIGFAGAEQSLQRVVARDDEPSHIDEKLAGNVKENEEEVDADEAEESVDFGNGCLLLKVVEHRVLGQLERIMHQHMLR